MISSFVAFIKSKDPALEDSVREAFVTEMANLEAFLLEKGPFVGGASPSAADMILAPRLYHAKVALKEFKVFFDPFAWSLELGSP